MIFVDEWKRTIDGQYKYKMDNFMHYLNGIGVPEGTAIESIEQLLDMFRGKPVRVYVKQEENEYKGEKQIVNRVAPWNFKRTKFPQVNHEWKSDDDKPSSNNAFAGGEDINDDDLPSNIPDELKQLKTGACGSLKSVMVNVQKYLLMQKLVSLLNQMIKAHGLVMKMQLMQKVSMG